MPTDDRPWTDADRETAAQALFEFGQLDYERPWLWWVEHRPRMAERARDRAEAVLDALTAAGWMRGHCPGCDCPDVPNNGTPPARRLVIGDTDAR